MNNQQPQYNGNIPIRYTVKVFSPEQKKRYERDALRMHILCVAFSCVQILSFLLCPILSHYFISGSIFVFSLCFAPVGILGIIGIIRKRPVSVGLVMALVFIALARSVFLLLFILGYSMIEMLLVFLLVPIIGGCLLSECVLFRFCYKNASPADELRTISYHVAVDRVDLDYPDDRSKNLYISRFFNALLIPTGLMIVVNLVLAVVGLILKRIILIWFSRIWSILSAAAICAQFVYFNLYGEKKIYDSVQGSAAPHFAAFVGLMLIDIGMVIILGFAVAAAYTAWKYKPAAKTADQKG